MVVTMLALSADTAEARNRVVALTATQPSAQRVEISNPTKAPITFTLGFNDQLFENRDALLKSIRAADTEQCRSLPSDMKLPCEAYYRVATALFHFPELTDQFGNTGWSPARWWAESPMLSINSFGFGTCGTFADVLGKIWEGLGYDTRRRELNGHTVTEVEVGGKWCMFDADTGGFFVEQDRVLGMDDLFENPECTAIENAKTVQSPNRDRDFPHEGMFFYRQLIAASASWRAVSDIPKGVDDWRELTVTIPPGGRMVFPGESRDECLFPAFVDYYAALGRDLTTPPHRYAVLEVPAGSVSDIRNGLYPVQITGNYCSEVLYLDSVISTDRYDQIRRFQYARRFGRTFRQLQAQSPLSIYYMLNANVTVRENNEVRLHGDQVDRLRVALVAADELSLSPDPVVPCGKVSSEDEEIAPIQLVVASSSSGGHAASNLVDGMLTTGWASAVVGPDEAQQIVLDLGEPQFIRGIRFTPHAAYGMLSPPTISVQTSQNGEEYDTAACIEDYRPSYVEWVTKRFDARYVRYVRLVVTPEPHFVGTGYFQVTLGEIEILR